MSLGTPTATIVAAAISDHGIKLVDAQSGATLVEHNAPEFK